MISERIIQIIPAPADIWIMRKDSKTGGMFQTRVICLALIEDDDGFRRVQTMGITDDGGYIEPLSG